MVIWDIFFYDVIESTRIWFLVGASLVSHGIMLISYLGDVIPGRAKMYKFVIISIEKNMLYKSRLAH